MAYYIRQPFLPEGTSITQGWLSLKINKRRVDVCSYTASVDDGNTIGIICILCIFIHRNPSVIIQLLFYPIYMTSKKSLLIVLLVLNAVVLLGQLWPEGVPPFARVVNILTLILDIAIILQLLRGKQ